MGKKRIKLGDEIRQAVKDSPLSRNAICRATGTNKGQLSRFVSGKAGLLLAAIDALADLLDLHIVAGRGKARRTTRKGKVTK